MKKDSRPWPAQPVINLIYAPEVDLHQVVEELVKAYGDIHGVSREFSFTETDYYQAEMGPSLLRRLICLGPPLAREELPGLKMTARDLEKRFAEEEKRRVNVDPGYVSLENFVLASSKNFSHRIYLGQGIYAEVTLIFERGSFRPVPWTYPFYRREAVIGFLNGVRERYYWQCREA